MSVVLSICTLAIVLCPTLGYNILGVFPHFGRSHFDIFLPIVQRLTLKGHQVTVVSYFGQEGNYSNVQVKLHNPGLASQHVLPFEALESERSKRFFEPWTINWLGQEFCQYGAKSKEVTKLLASNQSYDVILVEAFNSDCSLGFVHKYKAPFIHISSSAILPWFTQRLGIPDNPSYISSCFVGFSNVMTFRERLENALSQLVHKLVYFWSFQVKDRVTVEEVFGEDLPNLEDIARNVSLFLVNTHPVLNLARPLPPNVVEIGGVHIGKAKQLPKHIEKWINESKAGVIYFSMGSMIKGHTFPEEKRRAFLDAFAKLDQRVLWKWENETMPGKPDNVMIQKWMPQFDILCHPNVKAFVSHGGLLGTTEAVHCGVPTLAMPQFGDQHTNARALEAGGGGVVLNFADVDEESVLKALRTILDPEFNKKAKALSEKFRDRPMSAMDTAIYWIEYVARHKGADHLRTAAVGMPWYQYLLLDVVAFLATVTSLFLYFWYRITKALLRVAFRRKEKVKSH